MVARRFPDFDVYLNESLMPVLAQALDALGRQVSRMHQQGDKLDARVRARFNPITWLAQQLLRRHPRVANTPRRISLYRNFQDWADQERGRREVLRCKAKVLEVFNGFMQNGIVGRNSLPSIVEAVDDLFFLQGALKDSKSVQEHVLEGGWKGTRSSCLGGVAITFEQFWFKLANAVVVHEGILLSKIQEGRRLRKLREEEHARAMEAARIEEEQRQKEAQENQRLMNIFKELHSRLCEDQALKSILEGKSLTGEYLKPSDPEYESQVRPHGSHVLLLEELMTLLGLQTKCEHGTEGFEAQELEARLFRQKVQKQMEEEEEKEAEKEKEKRQRASKRLERGRSKEMNEEKRESMKRGSKEDHAALQQPRSDESPPPKRGSKKETGDAPMQRQRSDGRSDGSPSKRGSKEEAGVPMQRQKSDGSPAKRGSKEGPASKKGSKETINKRGSKEDVTKRSGSKEEGSKNPSKDEPVEEVLPGDRWWDPTMKSSWKILQAACGAQRTGNVDAEVLQRLLPKPEEFISIKKKVDAELRRIAENGPEEARLETVMEEQEKKPKPSMEELSLQYHMSRARLKFFHDLFESFLPAKEDGTPGVCHYPEAPSVIDKKTMFLLLKQVQSNINEAEFEARFRRLDQDSSGVIEFDEFVRWVHDDEVEVIGSAEKVKRTFEELANDMDVSIKLIMYVYDCFKFELGTSQVDEYPKTCAVLNRDQACNLAQILVTKLAKKKFDKYWEMVDVDKKGVVTFDDFCELLDFEDMAEDVLTKYNSDD
ncbi:unnamed protein product [Durusdinium trenchii]|uniref:EF-hand domain-containing protein n=1 Tax=Durusdinium trenchii TaxID=1381693 RepID=A0ABP0L7W6_9DINO